MNKSSICAALAVAIGLSASATSGVAQIRDELAAPAELPPASFTGRQYVDSRGCMYIRAGIDGNVTWVPRVDRNRQVICGQTASAPAAAPAPVASAPAPVAEPDPAPAAPAETAPRPVVTERPAPAAAPAAPRRAVQAPAPRRVAQPPAPRQVTQAPAQVAPKRRVRRDASGKTVIRHATPIVRNAPAPANKVIVRRAGQLPPNTVLRTPAGLSKGPTVVVRETGKAVRLADQGVKVFTGTSGIQRVTGQTRIAPKEAYVRGASVDVPVPEGYQRAFDDGRLSTTRAHQTLDGRRKMLLTWTNTVPRRLIDKRTGEEVSHYFPQLVYPYRSMKEQQAAGFVSSRGAVPEAAPEQQRRSAPEAVRKDTPKPIRKSAVAPASHRYVQLGTFSTPAKAQAAIRRVQAAGLPVRINEFSRAGVPHRMVLVGPFARQDRLRAALDTVRNRIGYRSASLRK